MNLANRIRWNRPGRAFAVMALAAAVSQPGTLAGQDLRPEITTPEEEFGQPLGADYFLATYQQLIPYWEKLAGESDRMVLDTIGMSEEGRPQLMAILTSPENHANLDRYKEISRTLALAEGVSEQQARALAAEGKAVIWIDGGLHATEVLGAQQLMEFVFRMNAKTDAETLRILDEVIILAAHANPDGHDLVAGWYMRNDDPLERSTSGVPVLYQKYAGHDNNRDFYMAALAETENMARVHYREWFPQIIYNHHQTGPAGTVMFAPPFRDPPNHNLDPMILTSLDRVGSAMHQRFVREGKGGTTMRSGAGYSTWWNGGLRTTPYFHNQIGLLTETIGHPTPIEIPFIPDRQIPHSDLPLPVKPGPWHFAQSVEYSQTANWAVLDYAARNRDHLLFNIWRMGMNSIERGSQDSWTVRQRRMDRASAALPERRTFGGTARVGDGQDFERLMFAPEERDPRGYVLPADQADFGTATKFVNALLRLGVTVHRASAPFTVAGTSYPEGSYVVKTAQAFRPHVIDMFEPQDHPDDFAYPGAPPTAPYDNAGWTLAFQMGVEFDRILDGFDGPFEPIEWAADVPAGTVAGGARRGYLLRHDANDAFVVVNRLMAEGRTVRWLLAPTSVDGQSFPAGTFYIENGRGVDGIVNTAAQELGLDFQGLEDRPEVESFEVEPVRIGLWDRYGGSMPSGWTRMILEDFEFPFEVVYPGDLDAGRLDRRFDVIVLEDGALSSGGFGGGGPDAASIPEEYRNRLGSISEETTIPQLQDFLERGGTVVTIGSSTALGSMLGLPVANHLVDAQGEPLASEDYYVPGSVLDLKLEHRTPLTHGLGERANVLFSRSPVFQVEDGAQGIQTLGWFDTPSPLRSGWAWGQEALEGGSALLEADVGRGKLFLLGPKVTFRAQAHGTFPLLFNAIYYGPARRPIME